jgi:ParB family transcriptional regulator, chromosome partitioning protein
LRQPRPTLAGLLAAQDSDVAPPTPSPAPAIGGAASAGALRAISSTLKQMSEDAGRSRELQEMLTSGQHIVDLQSDSIEASFIVDRIGERNDADFDRLVESIRDHGQQVPILVRPHPETSGKYQVAYGHRRLRAAERLKVPVRALVRNLSDAELVVAQGKENLERQDLSFIERALFAYNLEERSFERKTITAALGIDKGHLSNLISVARGIPKSLIMAIGPSPKAGKPRWTELAQKLKEPKRAAAANRIAQGSDFHALDTDVRFTRVMEAVSDKSKADPPATWSNAKGVKVVSIASRPGRFSLHIDKKAEPEFGAFLVDNLDKIYAEFKQRG